MTIVKIRKLTLIKHSDFKVSNIPNQLSVSHLQTEQKCFQNCRHSVTRTHSPRPRLHSHPLFCFPSNFILHSWHCLCLCLIFLFMTQIWWCRDMKEEWVVNCWSTMQVTSKPGKELSRKWAVTLVTVICRTEGYSSSIG